MSKKLRELLEVVTTKTETGDLQWQAFDDESFRVPIGEGYLHIQRGSTKFPDDDGELHPVELFKVQASDSQGRVVDEDEAAVGSSGFSVFARLFDVARKSALSTDRVLDDMLAALGAGK